MPVSTERSVTTPRTSAIRAPTPCAAIPPWSPYSSVVGRQRGEQLLDPDPALRSSTAA